VGDAVRSIASAHRELPERRTYAVVTLIYVLFVIYGSLVPLEFQAIPLDQAFEQFSKIFVLPMRVDSHTDVLTNVLLFIPLGYCWLAALRTDRRGAAGRLAAAVLIVVSSAALSVAIEFTQTFFRGRTVALSDIVAECSGGIVGVVLWLSCGETLTAFARSFSRERERPALMQRLLLVYSAGLFFSQILPLDLTFNLGELARKFRSGRIILVPFGYTHSSWFTAAWDYATDVVLSVPLGAAAALLWTPAGSKRDPWVAFGAGVAAVSFIEFVQLFVYSRFSDVTDIVTGSIGIALGVMAVMALSDRRTAAIVPPEAPGNAAALARMALAAWIVVLVGYHWRPFNFTVSHRRVVAGVHELLSVPFSWYYAGTEFHAFTEMSRKSLLALPLGVLLRLSWPDDRARWLGSRLRLVVLAGLAFCLLFAIEAGQVFLPGRVPDVTDAIVGELGVVAGLWLIGLFLASPQAQAEVAQPRHWHATARSAGPGKNGA
jgi:glycopeptide antibiotics resistance protein